MKVKVKASSLHGILNIPSSKSHTIRGILIGLIANGQSKIMAPLKAEDCISAINAAKMFGATIGCIGDHWLIEGTGGKLSEPNDIVNTGNSGMTTNILIPLASTIDSYTVITGDQQIRKRPVGELVKALRGLGGEAVSLRKDSDSCPVLVHGPIRGGVICMDGLISEFITGMLLTAPLLKEDTTILVDNPCEKQYLSMTIQWLRESGIDLFFDKNYKYFKIPGNQRYRSFTKRIPGDWSAAAFPLVAAICTNSNLVITGTDPNDVQGDKAILDILRNMGANIALQSQGTRLMVRGGMGLVGTLINISDIPDTFPALCVAAACAVGDTKFYPIMPLRFKETDRAAIMQLSLKKMGVESFYDEQEDSLTVKGKGRLLGAALDSFGDHRIAMALTVAGMAADGETIIENAQAVSVTFPEFFKEFTKSGAQISLM